MLEAEGALPLQIAEWAETCRTFVKEALQIELDFTPETLPILDHYLRVKAASPSPEVRDLLVPPLGAYFGEVVRRSMQGVRWHAPEEHYESYRVEFDSLYTNTLIVTPYRGAGRPQGVFVMERVMDAIARHLGLDRAVVRDRNFIQPDEMPYDWADE